MTAALVIAGTGSGTGKTTITLGIMAALTRRGYRVQPFKVGPDFIDPGHHARISGRVSHNLDGWMLTREANQEIFSRASRSADIAVVEGVMGLFDGKDGLSPEGSTAQMASWLGLPVLLVVDAKGMGRSAAALIKGFMKFDSQITIKWVVFNKIGSPRHLRLLRDAVSGSIPEVSVLGGLPRRPDVTIPERHLGLMTAEEHITEAQVDALACLAEESVDVDALLSSLGLTGPGQVACGGGRIRNAPPCGSLHYSTPNGVILQEVPSAGLLSASQGKRAGLALQKIRIAVARDKAFCFYYEDNLELLMESGATLVPFSPLEDTLLPPDISGIYLGGGYPELHAQALSANTSLAHEIRRCSLSGMPILAECGGHMYLCSAIEAMGGASWPMAGVLPFRTRMLARFSALGYREVVLLKDCVIGPAGTTVRGHEFHYSDYSEPVSGHVAISGQDCMIHPLFHVRDGRGRDLGTAGHVVKNTASSYVHLHFRSNPAIPLHFVLECRKYREEHADPIPCPT
ncbi:MAG: cobyrinate a,c-diamide synthase [Deltaproteobacteria bacterium]